MKSENSWKKNFAHHLSRNWHCSWSFDISNYYLPETKRTVDTVKSQSSSPKQETHSKMDCERYTCAWRSGKTWNEFKITILEWLAGFRRAAQLFAAGTASQFPSLLQELVIRITYSKGAVLESGIHGRQVCNRRQFVAICYKQLLQWFESIDKYTKH